MFNKVSVAVLFSFLLANLAWVGESHEDDKKYSLTLIESGAENLPEELWLLVGSFLEKREFHGLRALCTRFNIAINQWLNEFGWFENRQCGPASKIALAASALQIRNSSSRFRTIPTAPAILHDSLYYVLGHSAGERKFLKVLLSSDTNLVRTLTIENIEAIPWSDGYFDAVTVKGQLYATRGDRVVKLSNAKGEIQKATPMQIAQRTKDWRSDQKIIVVNDDFFLLDPRLKVSRLVDSGNGHFVKEAFWEENASHSNGYYLARNPLNFDNDRGFISLNAFGKGGANYHH